MDSINGDVVGSRLSSFFDMCSTTNSCLDDFFPCFDWRFDSFVVLVVRLKNIHDVLCCDCSCTNSLGK